MIGNAFGPSTGVMPGAARAGTVVAGTGTSGQATASDDRRANVSSAGARPGATAANPSNDAVNPSSDTASAKADAAPTHSAASRDAANTAKAAGDETSTGATDFATLLEASAVATASVATPLPAATPEAATPAAADPMAQAGLPDQLLALLSGNWALPPAAVATPVPAQAATTGATASALPTLANALPANAAAANATNPNSLTATVLTPGTTAAPAGSAPASASAGSFAALSELAAASALPANDTKTVDAGIASDSSGAPDPTALTATAPTVAPTRATAPAPTTAVVLPADPDAGFDDAFGSRIAWMAEQRIGHAEIRISPEHLGPIDVRVQLDGNRVSAEFHSAHAEVRQALEGSLTRLRDLLGQHGMQLSQADVGQRQPGQTSQGNAPRRDGADGGFGSSSDNGRQPAGDVTRMRTRGLLDEYA